VTGAQSDHTQDHHSRRALPIADQGSTALIVAYALASQLAAQLLQWIDDGTPPAVRERFSMPLVAAV